MSRQEKTKMDETIKEPHKEVSSDGENLLATGNRSNWVIGNKWFQKKEKPQGNTLQLGWQLRNRN
jgi:hypothetical protein